MLEALENSALAAWVRESPSIFSYTLVLSLHAIGLAIVLGTSTLIALRLLGVAPAIPIESLRRLQGFIWFGFVINLLSGLLLFIAEATKMAPMPAFLIKMSFVVIGMSLGQVIRKKVLEDKAALATNVLPASARSLAVVSLICWAVTLISGRLTGYPELVSGMLGL
jgi:hypothetical protein